MGGAVGTNAGGVLTIGLLVVPGAAPTPGAGVTEEAAPVVGVEGTWIGAVDTVGLGTVPGAMPTPGAGVTGAAEPVGGIDCACAMAGIMANPRPKTAR